MQILIMYLLGGDCTELEHECLTFITQEYSHLRLLEWRHNMLFLRLISKRVLLLLQVIIFASKELNSFS